MPATMTDSRLTLTLLKELLSQQDETAPCVALDRYQFALRSLVYACPRQAEGYCKDVAYDTLVEAMHQIYCQKETTRTPWIAQVEEITYDAFLRLRQLQS